MKRIYPAKIQDKLYLSRLLDQLLCSLEASPLQVHLKALSYNTQIPEPVFQRLKSLHEQSEDSLNITAEDFHILFSNILFRYPTVRMFQLRDHRIFIKM